jgi:Lecithin retinol acyltransferase
MEKGQHIFVRRPGGLFTRGMLHHGIDIGDGTVIHFTGFNKKDARVTRTSAKFFERYGKIEIFPYDRILEFSIYEFGEDVKKAIERNYYNIGEQVPPPNVRSLDPEQIVSESFRWLGEKFMNKEYSPFNNNCEHFATYCATGYPFSLQVQYEKEFLQRRPSMGGLLSVTLLESQRYYLNPRSKPKDGWYYLGTRYNDQRTGNFYHEHHAPGAFPPKWLLHTNSQDQVKEINQKSVPYPLIPIVHYYLNRNNQVREENLT